MNGAGVEYAVAVVRGYPGAADGLNANTFAHWRWRLGAASRLQPRAGIAPVKSVEIAAEQTPASVTFLELVLAGGRTIGVPCGFDGAELVWLVQALEGVRA